MHQKKSELQEREEALFWPEPINIYNIRNAVFSSHIADTIDKPKIDLFFSPNHSRIDIYLPFSWKNNAKKLFDKLFGPWPAQKDLALIGQSRMWRTWNTLVFGDYPQKGVVRQTLVGGPGDVATAQNDVEAIKTLIDRSFSTNTAIQLILTSPSELHGEPYSD